MAAVVVQHEGQPVDQRAHQPQTAARVQRGALLLDRRRGRIEAVAAVDAGPVEPHALLDAVLEALNPPSTDDITLLCLART